MSQRSLQRVMVSSGARISNDGVLAGIGCAGMTHPESLDIIIRIRGACAGVARPQTKSLARGQKGTDAGVHPRRWTDCRLGIDRNLPGFQGWKPWLSTAPTASN